MARPHVPLVLQKTKKIRYVAFFTNRGSTTTMRLINSPPNPRRFIPFSFPLITMALAAIFHLHPFHHLSTVAQIPPSHVPPAPPSIHHTCEIPRFLNYKYRLKHEIRATLQTSFSTMDARKLCSDFLRLLRNRRSHHVPLTVEPAKPVKDPVYQGPPPPPAFQEAMKSCPKADIENLKDLLVEENFYLHTESSEQGRLPVLILSVKESSGLKRPAVVFLHSTHKCKEWLRPLLEAYASRGYISIAIDSRYHGERASTSTTYQDALVSSWKNGDTMPFIFDTVWDLIKLADYLTQQRHDIDCTKIGITGESLGGMHAWFAAFVDTRYAVVAPIIGVQGFRWAIDNDMWHGRVDSIKAVFEEASADLNKSVIDKDVVEKVWDRITPGLASEFDAPYSVPAIAPRPLLILNGQEDPRCPLPGLDVPVTRAQSAYDAHGCSDNFKLIAELGIGHQMTSSMVKEASDWFDKFLK